MLLTFHFFLFSSLKQFLVWPVISSFKVQSSFSIFYSKYSGQFFASVNEHYSLVSYSSTNVCFFFLFSSEIFFRCALPC
uniref:Putative secreted protein n=1 Tax=Rhipicephalus microplus TaxID=6941 RepID=A0A6G5A2Z2_RHIMP